LSEQVGFEVGIEHITGKLGEESFQSVTLVLTTKPEQRDKTWNKNTKLPNVIKVALVTNRMYTQQ